jgi:glycosyltransferase involved in cell wall biosynthesis
MLKDLHKEQIDVYHGLSHEIPFGIHRLSFRKIVTIHDLIFKYYPQDYRKSDRLIYDSKVRYACKHADGIIAISQSTKNDIMKYYGTEEQKISVIYQTCDRVFSENAEFDLVNVRNKYSLPESYLLYVGSVISRKNLGNIIKAMSMLKTNLQVPLVILGSGNSYYKEVRSIISKYKLEHLVIHLSNVDFNDFPAIYRASKMLIYPSYYEGFGIPVLEAISSGTPVITSNQSSLTEAGGDVAHYVDPANIDEIADGIQILLEDEDYRALLLSRASRHLDKFKPRVLSEQLMDVYLQNG